MAPRSASVDNLLKHNTAVNAGKKSVVEDGRREEDDKCSNKAPNAIEVDTSCVDENIGLPANGNPQTDEITSAANQSDHARNRLQAVRCSSVDDSHAQSSFHSSRSATGSVSYNESVMYSASFSIGGNSGKSSFLNDAQQKQQQRKQTDVSSGTRSNTSYFNEPLETTSGACYKEGGFGVVGTSSSQDEGIYFSH